MALATTLSGIEECRARIPEWPEIILERLCGPNIIAVEGDVLPAERRDMGKQIIADNLTLGTQLSHSATEINGKQRREARGLLSVFNVGVPRSCLNPSSSRRVSEADE